MNEAPNPPGSPYEQTTWERFLDAFPWRKQAYLAWRDFHRATLARLFADPRMTEAAKDAVREML